MVYAPVIICTLNRYEHFKRCIESLENNPWAKYTEIFISVDYPPEEKYVEGHDKIVDYLNSRKFKFKEVHLYVQEENLGTLPNYLFLQETVFEQYDRLISLEDDIEVSPNYLEFMDKSLEYGKSDEKVFCVCGFSDLIKKPATMNGTAFKLCCYQWGVGIYKEKWLQMEESLTREWINSIVLDKRRMFKLFCESPQTFYFFLVGYIINKDKVFFMDEERVNPIDITILIYMIMNNMYSILPTKSKVRNWGYDGTGQNCGLNENMLPQKQELDMEQEFEFRLETDKKKIKILERRNRKAGWESNWVLWKSLLYYFYLYFRHRLS